MGQISTELRNRLSIAVERMPAFPRSVQRILELTRDINCQPRELVAVIEKDPVIALKILKIVNSAYYSLPTKITSINHSVVYLGINTIKNLALNFSAMGMLPRKNSAGFDMDAYLIHSLTCANLTRQLALVFAADEVDTDDAYIVGLLHNFGKVVYAQFMVEDFRQALDLVAKSGLTLHQAEERIIGADHALAGAMLVQYWKFPEHIVEVIAQHHAEYVKNGLGECLYLGDMLAQALIDAGDDGELKLPAGTVLPERFAGDLKTVLDSLEHLDELVAEAQMFCKGSGYP